MNLHISVDIHENIVIATDTYLTADELLAAVCDYPFLVLNSNQVISGCKSMQHVDLY